jgi:hypothetical protein
MLDANLIAALETSLQQTRNTQSQRLARLREVENEAQALREEIAELETMAEQTASAIDTLLVTMRTGSRGAKLGRASGSDERYSRSLRSPSTIDSGRTAVPPRSGSVAYLDRGRGPAGRAHIEPVSNRFADRTITQACTLLLREAGKPLHVNELYHLLVAGGMEFKGNNPTISVAVSLNRNRRFRKVGPGTFDLVIREASQQAAS